MLVTVRPCFHWIGYHMTANLLQEGEEVIGIDPLTSDLSHHLYMFVGRNSNFQHFYDKKDKEHFIHKEPEEIFVQYEQNELSIEQNQSVILNTSLPKLYGEWMDLPDERIQSEEDMWEWIMEHEATYIGDFFRQSLPEKMAKCFLSHKNGRDSDQLRREVREVWRTIQRVNSLEIRGF